MGCRRGVVRAAKKAAAFFVAVSFTLLETSANPYRTLYAQTPPFENIAGKIASQIDPFKILSELKIPEEMGSVEEKYIPEGQTNPGKTVLLIQSAHGNYDAETNTRRLIEWIGKEYPLPLVLLEGGAGKLDSLLFKSFPDAEIKGKILDEYLRAGELSGGEVASILDDHALTEFSGIETQSLYEANKKAFLEAIDREKDIREILAAVQSSLDRAAKTTLSPQAQTFVEKKKAFDKDNLQLLDYLKTVQASIPPAAADEFPRRFPGLLTLLESSAKARESPGEDYDKAMKKFVDSFVRKVIPKLPKAEGMKINRSIQEYQTGRLDGGALIHQMTAAAKQAKFSFRIPGELRRSAAQALRLSAIKGTKLFAELRAFEGWLCSQLGGSPAGRGILEDYERLSRLSSFSALELLPEQWEQMKDIPAGEYLGSVELPPASKEAMNKIFEPHYRFYRLARERDGVLYQNALGRADAVGARLAVVTAGGFHTTGMTEKLKADKIPYAVIMPKIDKIGDKDRDHYLSAMYEKCSFMKYYRGSMWEAFARDYTARLGESLKKGDVTPALKRWRDAIIQNSIAEGRVTQAGEYTQYVDALVQALREEFEKESPVPALSRAELRRKIAKELESFNTAYFGNLRSALKQRVSVLRDGLKGMWESGNITAQSVGELMGRLQTAPKSGLSPPSVLARPELRVTTAAAPERISSPRLEQTASELRNLGYSPQKLDGILKALSAVGTDPEIERVYHVLARGGALDHVAEVRGRLGAPVSGPTVREQVAGPSRQEMRNDEKSEDVSEEPSEEGVRKGLESILKTMNWIREPYPEGKVSPVREKWPGNKDAVIDDNVVFLEGGKFFNGDRFQHDALLDESWGNSIRSLFRFVQPKWQPVLASIPQSRLGAIAIERGMTFEQIRAAMEWMMQPPIRNLGLPEDLKAKLVSENDFSVSFAGLSLETIDQEPDQGLQQIANRLIEEAETRYVIAKIGPPSAVSDVQVRILPEAVRQIENSDHSLRVPMRHQLISLMGKAETAANSLKDPQKRLKRSKGGSWGPAVLDGPVGAHYRIYTTSVRVGTRLVLVVLSFGNPDDMSESDKDFIGDKTQALQDPEQVIITPASVKPFQLREDAVNLARLFGGFRVVPPAGNEATDTPAGRLKMILRESPAGNTVVEKVFEVLQSGQPQKAKGMVMSLKGSISQERLNEIWEILQKEKERIQEESREAGAGRSKKVRSEMRSQEERVEELIGKVSGILTGEQDRASPAQRLRVIVDQMREEIAQLYLRKLPHVAVLRVYFRFKDLVEELEEEEARQAQEVREGLKPVGEIFSRENRASLAERYPNLSGFNLDRVAEALKENRDLGVVIAVSTTKIVIQLRDADGRKKNEVLILSPLDPYVLPLLDENGKKTGEIRYPFNPEFDVPILTEPVRKGDLYVWKVQEAVDFSPGGLVQQALSELKDWNAKQKTAEESKWQLWERINDGPPITVEANGNTYRVILGLKDEGDYGVFIVDGKLMTRVSDRQDIVSLQLISSEKNQEEPGSDFTASVTAVPAPVVPEGPRQEMRKGEELAAGADPQGYVQIEGDNIRFAFSGLALGYHESIQIALPADFEAKDLKLVGEFTGKSPREELSVDPDLPENASLESLRDRIVRAARNYSPEAVMRLIFVETANSLGGVLKEDRDRLQRLAPIFGGLEVTPYDGMEKLMRTVSELADDYRGRRLGLGRFVSENAGVCRHRAMLFKFLADAVNQDAENPKCFGNLKVSIERGRTFGGRHAVNKAVIGGKTYWVDTFGPPEITENYAERAAIQLHEDSLAFSLHSQVNIGREMDDFTVKVQMIPGTERLMLTIAPKSFGPRGFAEGFVKGRIDLRRQQDLPVGFRIRLKEGAYRINDRLELEPAAGDVQAEFANLSPLDGQKHDLVKNPLVIFNGRNRQGETYENLRFSGRRDVNLGLPANVELQILLADGVPGVRLVYRRAGGVSPLTATIPLQEGSYIDFGRHTDNRLVMPRWNENQYGVAPQREFGAVSRFHGVVEVRGGVVYISDNQSKNGMTPHTPPDISPPIAPLSSRLIPEMDRGVLGGPAFDLGSRIAQINLGRAELRSDHFGRDVKKKGGWKDFALALTAATLFLAGTIGTVGVIGSFQKGSLPETPTVQKEDRVKRLEAVSEGIETRLKELERFARFKKEIEVVSVSQEEMNKIVGEKASLTSPLALFMPPGAMNGLTGEKQKRATIYMAIPRVTPAGQALEEKIGDQAYYLSKFSHELHHALLDQKISGADKKLDATFRVWSRLVTLFSKDKDPAARKIGEELARDMEGMVRSARLAEGKKNLYGEYEYYEEALSMLIAIAEGLGTAELPEGIKISLGIVEAEEGEVIFSVARGAVPTDKVIKDAAGFLNRNPDSEAAKLFNQYRGYLGFPARQEMRTEAEDPFENLRKLLENEPEADPFADLKTLVDGIRAEEAARQSEVMLSTGESLLPLTDPTTGIPFAALGDERQALVSGTQHLRAGLDLKFTPEQRAGFLEDAVRYGQTALTYAAKDASAADQAQRLQAIAQMELLLLQKSLAEGKKDDAALLRDLKDRTAADDFARAWSKYSGQMILAMVLTADSYEQTRLMRRAMSGFLADTINFLGRFSRMQGGAILSRWVPMMKEIENYQTYNLDEHDYLGTRKLFALNAQRNLALERLEALKTSIGAVDWSYEFSMLKGKKNAQAAHQELFSRIQQFSEELRLLNETITDLNDQINKEAEALREADRDIYAGELLRYKTMSEKASAEFPAWMDALYPLSPETSKEFLRFYLKEFIDSGGKISGARAQAFAQLVSSAMGLNLEPSLFEGAQLVFKLPDTGRRFAQDAVDLQYATLVFPTEQAMRNFRAALGHVSMEAAGLYFNKDNFKQGSFLREFPLTIAYGDLATLSYDDREVIMHEERHKRDPYSDIRRGKERMLTELIAYYSKAKLQKETPGYETRRDFIFRGTAETMKLYYSIHIADPAQLSPADYSKMVDEAVGLLNRLDKGLPEFLVERILFNSKTVEDFMRWKNVSEDMLRSFSEEGKVPKKIHTRSTIERERAGITYLGVIKARTDYRRVNEKRAALREETEQALRQAEDVIGKGLAAAQKRGAGKQADASGTPNNLRAGRSEIRMGMDPELTDFIDQKAEEIGLDPTSRGSLRDMLASPYLDVRLEGMKAIEFFPPVAAQVIARKMLEMAADGTELFAAFAIAANLGVFDHENELLEHPRFSSGGVEAYLGPLRVQSKNGILTKAVARYVEQQINKNSDDFLATIDGLRWLSALLIIEDARNYQEQRKIAQKFMTRWRGEDPILGVLQTELTIPKNVLDVLRAEDLDPVIEARLRERQDQMVGQLTQILETDDWEKAQAKTETYFYFHSSHYDLQDIFFLRGSDHLSRLSLRRIKQQVGRLRDYGVFAEFVTRHLEGNARKDLARRIDASKKFPEYEDLRNYLRGIDSNLARELEVRNPPGFPSNDSELEKLMLRDFVNSGQEIRGDATGFLHSYLAVTDAATRERMIRLMHAVATAKPQAVLPVRVERLTPPSEDLGQEQMAKNLYRALLEHGLPGRNPVNDYLVARLLEGTMRRDGDNQRIAQSPPEIISPATQKMLFDIVIHPEEFPMGFEEVEGSGKMADIRTDDLQYSLIKQDILLFFARLWTRGEKLNLSEEEETQLRQSFLEFQSPQSSMVPSGDLYAAKGTALRFRQQGLTPAVLDAIFNLMRDQGHDIADREDLRELFSKALQADAKRFRRNAAFVFAGKTERDASRLSWFPSADDRLRVLAELSIQEIIISLAGLAAAIRDADRTDVPAVARADGAMIQTVRDLLRALIDAGLLQKNQLALDPQQKRAKIPLTLLNSPIRVLLPGDGSPQVRTVAQAAQTIAERKIRQEMRGDVLEILKRARGILARTDLDDPGKVAALETVAGEIENPGLKRKILEEARKLSLIELGREADDFETLQPLILEAQALSAESRVRGALGQRLTELIDAKLGELGSNFEAARGRQIWVEEFRRLIGVILYNNMMTPDIHDHLQETWSEGFGRLFREALRNGDFQGIDNISDVRQGDFLIQGSRFFIVQAVTPAGGIVLRDGAMDAELIARADFERDLTGYGRLVERAAGAEKTKADAMFDLWQSALATHLNLLAVQTGAGQAPALDINQYGDFFGEFIGETKSLGLALTDQELAALTERVANRLGEQHLSMRAELRHFSQIVKTVRRTINPGYALTGLGVFSFLHMLRVSPPVAGAIGIWVAALQYTPMKKIFVRVPVVIALAVQALGRAAAQISPFDILWAAAGAYLLSSGFEQLMLSKKKVLGIDFAAVAYRYARMGQSVNIRLAQISGLYLWRTYGGKTLVLERTGIKHTDEHGEKQKVLAVHLWNVESLDAIKAAFKELLGDMDRLSRKGYGMIALPVLSPKIDRLIRRNLFADPVFVSGFEQISSESLPDSEKVDWTIRVNQWQRAFNFQRDYGLAKSAGDRFEPKFYLISRKATPLAMDAADQGSRQEMRSNADAFDTRNNPATGRLGMRSNADAFDTGKHPGTGRSEIRQEMRAQFEERKIWDAGFRDGEKAIAEREGITTVVFDLDNTLAYATVGADGQLSYKLRPGLQGQLEKLILEGLRLVLWTYSPRENVEIFFRQFPEIGNLFDLALTRENYVGPSSAELKFLYPDTPGETLDRFLAATNDSGVKDITLLGYSLIVDDGLLNEKTWIPELHGNKQTVQFHAIRRFGEKTNAEEDRKEVDRLAEDILDQLHWEISATPAKKGERSGDRMEMRSNADDAAPLLTPRGESAARPLGGLSRLEMRANAAEIYSEQFGLVAGGVMAAYRSGGINGVAQYLNRDVSNESVKSWLAAAAGGVMPDISGIHYARITIHEKIEIKLCRAGVPEKEAHALALLLEAMILGPRAAAARELPNTPAGLAQSAVDKGAVKKQQQRELGKFIEELRRDKASDVWSEGEAGDVTVEFSALREIDEFYLPGIRIVLGKNGKVSAQQYQVGAFGGSRWIDFDETVSGIFDKESYRKFKDDIENTGMDLLRSLQATVVFHQGLAALARRKAEEKRARVREEFEQVEREASERAKTTGARQFYGASGVGQQEMARDPRTGETVRRSPRSEMRETINVLGSVMAGRATGQTRMTDDDLAVKLESLRQIGAEWPRLFRMAVHRVMQDELKLEGKVQAAEGAMIDALLAEQNKVTPEILLGLYHRQGAYPENVLPMSMMSGVAGKINEYKAALSVIAPEAAAEAEKILKGKEELTAPAAITSELEAKAGEIYKVIKQIKAGTVIQIDIPDTAGAEGLIRAALDALAVLGDLRFQFGVDKTSDKRSVDKMIGRIKGKIRANISVGDRQGRIAFSKADWLGTRTPSPSKTGEAKNVDTGLTQAGEIIQPTDETMAQVLIAILTAAALKEKVSDVIDIDKDTGIIRVSNLEALSALGLVVHMLAAEARAEMRAKQAA
jgi:hypothetical protein